MRLSSDDLQRAAKLARLNLDDAAFDGQLRALDSVMQMCSAMQAVDCTGVEAMAHPTDATLALRDDVVTEVDQREKFQAVAPNAQDGYYLVPQVIEQ